MCFETIIEFGLRADPAVCELWSVQSGGLIEFQLSRLISAEPESSQSAAVALTFGVMFHRFVVGTKT